MGGLAALPDDDRRDLVVLGTLRIDRLAAMGSIDNLHSFELAEMADGRVPGQLAGWPIAAMANPKPVIGASGQESTLDCWIDNAMGSVR